MVLKNNEKEKIEKDTFWLLRSCCFVRYVLVVLVTALTAVSPLETLEVGQRSPLHARIEDGLARHSHQGLLLVSQVSVK